MGAKLGAQIGLKFQRMQTINYGCRVGGAPNGLKFARMQSLANLLAHNA